MKANDRQVGGDHYRTASSQHWDRVAELGLDYFQGQITKYVERWKKKNGVQDLEKARHFLDKYIELANAGGLTDWKPLPKALEQKAEVTAEKVAKVLQEAYDAADKSEGGTK